jgi:predicted ribosome quality control (RQC) complex YloA/Tae2 family protein
METKYLVGKNARNNWQIYGESDQTDTIFHLDGQSSPYVIVNKPISELTNEEKIEAASKCKAKSKFKNELKVPVMYTSVDNTYLGKTVGLFIVKSLDKRFLMTV